MTRLVLVVSPLVLIATVAVFCSAALTMHLVSSALDLWLRLLQMRLPLFKIRLGITLSNIFVSADLPIAAFSSTTNTVAVDLSEPHFTEPLCQTFRGNVPALSKQKFSSNVIEKCIRTADFQTRRLLIQEMMGGNELERMLRDSFANYVVQTAIDFADAETRGRLMDAVRPILPVIRQTPHGRRIAGKMVSLETQNRPNTNGQVTPNGVVSEENGMFGSGRTFPTVTTSFPPQFKFPDNMIAKPPGTMSSDSTSTKNGDDTETVIFSPTPQHSNNAINGLNGVNAANFSLY